MVSTEVLARILLLYLPIVVTVGWGLRAKKLYWPEAVTLLIGGISFWMGFMVKGNGEAIPPGRLLLLAVASYCVLKLLLMHAASVRVTRLRELFTFEAEVWRKAKATGVEATISVIVFFLGKLIILFDALSKVKLRRRRKVAG